MSDAIAEIEGLLEVNRDFCKKQMAEKGIASAADELCGSALEAWFQEKHLSDYQEHIKFLRDLQELRSSGTGHRKGKGYQKISKAFDIQRENYAETFSNILDNVISFLNYIEAHFEELSQ